MSKPRKVLIIVENEPVPFDTRVWKEALSLTANGYQVSVICPKQKGYTKTYECLDGIHIYRHPAPADANSPLGYLVEFSNALFWEFILSWWVFIRRGFHVIQGCNPPDNIFLVALPFRSFGVKYIFDHHDANPELYLAKYGLKGILYRIQLLLENMTYRFSDVVMATNLSYKDLAVKRGHKDPANLFVVRNGPDPETFKPVPPNPALKNGKQFMVGYVGTMSSQDGLEILLDVASYIKNTERKDVHFTCVGGGPGLADLQRLTREKDLTDTVTFTGRVSDEALLQILSSADVCVNPDVPCEMNDISTMTKIMEYMALGKPIVQFDLKEGRFSAGEASLYATKDDDDQVADFARKIVWLLEHPEQRERMGQIGRRRVCESLGWQYSASQLLCAYDRAFSM